MTRPIPPCGTTAAFQRHRYRGERPCDPCRRAYNAHQAAYLRRTGRARARQRAYVRLAHAHPDEHKILRGLELETAASPRSLGEAAPGPGPAASEGTAGPGPLIDRTENR